MAEHTEIYQKDADGDTFFETTRRQILRHSIRQLDDIFILSEALEGFFKNTEILAKKDIKKITYL